MKTALATYEPVLGFEVHVELNTETKMFSTATNAFGDQPNSNVTAGDLGMPGTLPTINRAGIEYGIKLGLALNCTIAEASGFSRKQYFYPDLGKNYQTSQEEPAIAYDGYVDVELDDGEIFRVEIERAHIEEDAGKLTHIGSTGRIHDASASLVDYNRAGVPLVEIVSRPITGAGERAPELARAYLATIRDIVKALGVSDARMERGNIRCDANVSLMPIGSATFGTRTETKNVNSTRAVAAAVESEIIRQAKVLDAGDSILQETRHWDEEARSTRSGRPKSDADDYRYFPDPDLVPVVTDAAWIERLRADLPENPLERRRRLRDEWDYSESEFRDVVAAGVLDEIEATVTAGATPEAARKWWMGEIARIANEKSVSPEALGVTAADVVEIEQLIADKTINDKIARQIVGHIADGEGRPAEIVEARSLAVVSDDGALTSAVEEAMASNPDVVERIKGGHMQAVGALIGPVMKATKGQADAGRVREIILEKIS